MAFANLRRRPDGRAGSPVRRRDPGPVNDREHQSINARHKWRRRPIAFVGQGFSYVGTLLLFVLIAQAIVVVIIGRTVEYIPLDKRCQVSSVSCGLLSGIAVPILTIAFASTTFLFFRLARVRKGYRRRARDRPRELVPTAGRILERVVGRDELSYVIMDNLVDRRTRRAFVIVGGVGAGKTAVLVQLTKLLAKSSAIPVPIMLREAQSVSKLDFRKLANSKFTADVAGSLLYDGEGERAWRQLNKDDRIVVLADGLEEALIDDDERNNIIRLAIEQANSQKLPLVIASRPHDPLRNMEAAIIELEPLSEQAALSYMKEDGRSSSSAERLDWIVGTAEVAEEPIYLQITRELHKNGLLEHASPGNGHMALETRDADRTELRLHLLNTWTDALMEGHFPAGLAMSHEDRRIALESAAALACVGVKLDTVDVQFSDLLGPPPQYGEKAANCAAHDAGARSQETRFAGDTGGQVAEGIGAAGRKVKLQALGREEPHQVITELMARRLGGLKPDVQVAAAWAEQLGLVEVRGSGVRFPHSILQAYLGSRMMSAALRDDRYCMEAAQKPGREFLIAVVMYFRSGRASEPGPASQEDQQEGRPPSSWVEDVAFILALLRQSAQVQDVGAKRLDVYAAALEIDSANGGLQHEDIAKEVRKNWPQTTMTYDRPLEEAKIGLVRRFGEAIRKVAKSAQEQAEAAGPTPPGDNPDGHVRPAPAYHQLHQIGIREKSYPVRLAVAQEIGSGGDQAYRSLMTRFSRVRAALDKDRETTEGLSDEDAQRKWREEALCAWLAPLLAGSVSSEPDNHGGTNEQRASESPRSILNGWLGHVGQGGARPGRASLPLSLEIALAQGFKYAANRKRQGTQSETRAWLAEEASQMLKRSRFWFTQLTLLHALCLWTLRDENDADPVPRGHGSQPEAIVRQWLAIAGSEHTGGPQGAGPTVHPFVEEAGRLVVLALKEQRPDQYIWIDESGVTGIVGSHANGLLTGRKQQLWIPPSTGWSVLDPRAQRLVADVLLLLNLAERGDRPQDHDRRLGFTDRQDLPPCLTSDRSFLNPGRPVGAADAGVPGSNCMDGCHFRLCPYPPWGGPSYRVELSGPFCRNQQVMLRNTGRTPAPWQKMPARELKKSWAAMADRSRGARRPGETE